MMSAQGMPPIWYARATARTDLSAAETSGERVMSARPSVLGAELQDERRPREVECFSHPPLQVPAEVLVDELRMVREERKTRRRGAGLCDISKAERLVAL